jgi:sulfur carrier protein
MGLRTLKQGSISSPLKRLRQKANLHFTSNYPRMGFTNTEQTMRITLNGNEKTLTNPIGLQDLVGQFAKNPKHIIAEVNGEILRSSQWTGKTVKDGDKIELVSFVGGG